MMTKTSSTSNITEFLLEHFPDRGVLTFEDLTLPGEGARIEQPPKQAPTDERERLIAEEIKRAKQIFASAGMDLPPEYRPKPGPAQTSVFLTDHAGTPLQLVDAEGDVIWTAEADDWAAVIRERGVRQPIRFQGQWLDEESGFFYNRYRYYDSKLGRYITADPIGLFGGLNGFIYPFNPVMKLDPLGLCNCKLPKSEDFMDENAYLNYNRSGAEVWQKIGGNLDEGYGENSPDGTQNSCAARLSHGLNYSGAPIPRGASGANYNYGDKKRYIISAEKMNDYLKKTYGSPTITVKTEAELDAVIAGLKNGQAAIVSSKGHAAVVTKNYEDPYVRAYLGDVWVLPMKAEACQCN